MRDTSTLPVLASSTNLRKGTEGTPTPCSACLTAVSHTLVTARTVTGRQFGVVPSGFKARRVLAPNRGRSLGRDGWHAEGGIGGFQTRLFLRGLHSLIPSGRHSSLLLRARTAGTSASCRRRSWCRTAEPVACTPSGGTSVRHCGPGYAAGTAQPRVTVSPAEAGPVLRGVAQSLAWTCSVRLG